MIVMDLEAESRIDAASQALAITTNKGVDLTEAEFEVRPTTTISGRELKDRYKVTIYLPQELPSRFTYEELMNY